MSGNYSPEGQHDFIPDDVRELQQAINPAVLDAYYHQACADFRATVFQKMFAHQATVDGSGWATFDLNCEEQGSIAMADGAVDVLLQMTQGTDKPEIDGHTVPDVSIMTNEHIVGLSGEHSFLTYVFVLSPSDHAHYGWDAFTGNQKEDGALISPYKSLFFFNETDRKLKLVYPGGDNKARAQEGAVINHDESIIRPFGARRCIEDNFYALRTAELLLEQIVSLEPQHTVKDSLT